MLPSARGMFEDTSSTRAICAAAEPLTLNTSGSTERKSARPSSWFTRMFAGKAGTFLSMFLAYCSADRR